MGQRVVNEIVGTTTSDYEIYSYDAGGNVMAIYSLKYVSNKYEMRLAEVPIYGSDRFGEYKPNLLLTNCASCTTVTGITNVANSTVQTNVNGGNYKTPLTFTYTTGTLSRKLGIKEYEIKNHLGNVLVTVSDRKLAFRIPGNSTTSIDYYLPMVMTHSDYYPYGMPINSEGRTGIAVSGTNYRFGFGGQEKDNEVAGNGNSYTAEFWQYDPRIGRRWNVDPMTAGYAGQSPYACFNNNPIYYTDPSGLEGEDYFKGKNGEVIWADSKDATITKNGETYTNIGSTYDGPVNNSGAYWMTGDANGNMTMYMNEWTKYSSGGGEPTQAVYDRAMSTFYKKVNGLPDGTTYTFGGREYTHRVKPGFFNPYEFMRKQGNYADGYNLMADILLVEAEFLAFSFGGGVSATMENQIAANVAERTGVLTREPLVLELRILHEGELVPIYRGGRSFTLKPSDIKVDPKTGLVKTTHGPSLNVHSAQVSKFGGAHRVRSLPKGLNIIQRGNKPNHYEVVPAHEMPVNEFQQLLRNIRLSF